MKSAFSVLAFFWGLCALSLATATAQAQPAAAGVIRASRVTGTVAAVDLATQAESRVADGQTLAQGQAVRTDEGASIILLFSNGSSVNIGESSYLSIDAFLQDPFSGTVDQLATEPTRSTTRLKLNYGELVGNVKRLNTGSEYTVQTPVGAAGIRGTSFMISFNAQTGALRLSMDTGLIVFTSIAPVDAATPPQEVSVEAGQEVSLSASVNAQGQVTAVQVTTGTVAPETRSAITEAVQQAVQEMQGQTFTPAAPAAPGQEETPPAEEQQQQQTPEPEQAAATPEAQQGAGQSQGQNQGNGGTTFPVQPIDRDIISPSS